MSLVDIIAIILAIIIHIVFVYSHYAKQRDSYEKLKEFHKIIEKENKDG